MVLNKKSFSLSQRGRGRQQSSYTGITAFRVFQHSTAQLKGHRYSMEPYRWILDFYLHMKPAYCVFVL